MKITSIDSLDAAAADLVRRRIEHTAATAAMEAEVAAVQKRHQVALNSLLEDIADRESAIRDYCHAHRATLFAERKSRETPLCVFGFRLTPWRVEPANRKIKWSQVVERLQRLVWGESYLRYSEPKVNKEALLADRGTLPPAALAAAAIRFEQDDEWFLDPKPDTAQNPEL